MLTSLIETLAYKLALRRTDKRTVRPLPEKLSDRRLLLLMPFESSMIEAALTLIHQIELPPEQMKLVWIGRKKPSGVGVDEYPTRHVMRSEFDWFRLPSQAVCEDVFKPEPHVAIDLNTAFVLPAAYVVGRSPAVFRMGVHHPEAEPFRDILYRYEGEGKEAYLALRRILYTIEPAIVPMQPMSTRVFY